MASSKIESLRNAVARGTVSASRRPAVPALGVQLRNEAARTDKGKDNDDNDEACPRCDKNDSDAKFCKACGRELHREASEGSARSCSRSASQEAHFQQAVATLSETLGITKAEVIRLSDSGKLEGYVSRYVASAQADNPLASIKNPAVLKAALLNKTSQAIIDDGDGEVIGLPTRAEAKAIFERAQAQLNGALR